MSLKPANSCVDASVSLQSCFHSMLLCKHVSVYERNKSFRGCFIFIIIKEITQASRKQHVRCQQVGTQKEQEGSVVPQSSTTQGLSHFGSCWAPAAGLMPKGTQVALDTHTQAAELNLGSSRAVQWCYSQSPSPSYSSQKTHALTTSCFSLLSSCPSSYFLPTSMQESRYLIRYKLLWTPSAPVPPVT